ncbi:MAG TPA: hypothetical protein VER55_12105, partial [Ardenticatenaceae bacterium]|nr:hypothetical protein [Ardenticatenaceae bacterium]
MAVRQPALSPHPLAMPVPAPRGRFSEIGRLLKRDRGGMLGLVLFVLITLAAVFAPWITPHDPLSQNLRVAK